MTQHGCALGELGHTWHQVGTMIELVSFATPTWEILSP